MDILESEQSTDTASLPYLTPGLATFSPPNSPHGLACWSPDVGATGDDARAALHGCHDSPEDVVRIVPASRLANVGDSKGPGCLDEIQSSQSGQMWSPEQ